MANLTETLYLAEVGSTDAELELKVNSNARDKFWKEQLKCPDGFVKPHDSIVIPDPFLALLKGDYKVGDIIEKHDIQEGSYDTQGTNEPCYAYIASRVVRVLVPAGESYDPIHRRFRCMLGEKAQEIESIIGRIPDIIESSHEMPDHGLINYGTKLAILGFHMYSQGGTFEFNQFCAEVAEKMEKDKTLHPGGGYLDEHAYDRSPQWTYSEASIKEAREMVNRKFSQEIKL